MSVLLPSTLIEDVYLLNNHQLLLHLDNSATPAELDGSMANLKDVRRLNHNNLLLLFDLSTNESTVIAKGDVAWPGSRVHANGIPFYWNSGKGFIPLSNPSIKIPSLVASFANVVISLELPQPSLFKDIVNCLPTSVGRWIAKRYSSEPAKIVLSDASLARVSSVPLEPRTLPLFPSPVFGTSQQMFCLATNTGRLKLFSLQPFREVADYPYPTKYIWFFPNPDPDCLTVLTEKAGSNVVQMNVLDARHLSENRSLLLRKVDEISRGRSPETFVWACAGEFICWASRGTDRIYLRPIGHPEAMAQTVAFNFDKFSSSASGTELIAWNHSTFGIWALGQSVQLDGLFTIKPDAAGNPVVVRCDEDTQQTGIAAR